MKYTRTMTFLQFLLYLFLGSSALDQPCPIYPVCTRYPTNPDGVCSGSDLNNPCPSGRSVCTRDVNTNEVVSCCCIKYDPFYKHLAAGSLKPPLKQGKLRIYYMRFCPFSQRVMMTTVAKHFKNVDVVYLNLKSKPEWFATRLGGSVPIIEREEDDYIKESLFETDYLDEALYFNQLYPQDLFRKAQDRQLIDAYNKFIPSLLFDILYGKGYTNSSATPEMLEKFENYVNQLGTELVKRGTTFFGGDQPGMVDYMIWPWMERRQTFQLFYPTQYDYSKTSPIMNAWVEEMKQDNAVSSFALRPEAHFEYVVSVRAGNPNYDMMADN